MSRFNSLLHTEEAISILKIKNVLSYPEACEGNLVEYRNVGVAERMAALRGLAPVAPVVRTH